MSDLLLHGACDERFQSLRDLADVSLRVEEETGLSLVINIDGVTVVDLWGGFRDAGRTRQWVEDTIANVWSTTKTITSLAALLLVERGELDVHSPAARYWPGFAANGKQDIQVCRVLGHTSGVSGWEQPFRTEDMYDWDLATARLAAQCPWWEPGTASGYHAHNQGHLVGELVVGSLVGP